MTVMFIACGAASLYFHSWWPIGIFVGTLAFAFLLMAACGELKND